MILDIFARRARSREGRLQVELAQLDYMLPRLSGKGALMSRLGGGIGTRGPGEMKLETDGRRIRQRIQSVKREIERVRRYRTTRREARQRTEKRRLRLQRLSFGRLGRQARADPEEWADSDDPRRALQAMLDRHDRELEEWRQRVESRRQRLQRLSFGLLGRRAQAENGQAA